MMNSRYSVQYEYSGGRKMLSSIFERFIKESPVSLMMQVLMSHIFEPERMDRLFTKHAKRAVSTRLAIFFSSKFDEFGSVWNPMRQFTQLT